MANFKTTMTIEEILEIMNHNQGITETIHAGSCFLQYKMHESLLEKQNIYNEKQLFWSRILAAATWALVIVTLLLIKWG